MHNLGKTSFEAKNQALALLKSNVQTQAHTTSINDAFYVLGLLLGAITLALMLEALWEVVKIRRQKIAESV